MPALKVCSCFHFIPKPNPPLCFWMENATCDFDVQATSAPHGIFRLRNKRHDEFWRKVKMGETLGMDDMMQKEFHGRRVGGLT